MNIITAPIAPEIHPNYTIQLDDSELKFISEILEDWLNHPENQMCEPKKIAIAEQIIAAS